MENNQNIKQRNIFVGALLTVITFSIYVIYWLVQTKKEINQMGGKIPTAWLIIIPFVNIYWFYKYSVEFAQTIKKNDSGLLYFIVYLVFFPAFPIIVQSALNKYEHSSSSISTSNSSQELQTTTTQNSFGELSQNEITSKTYIEQYKSQYSRESIKTQLVNAGIPSEEIDTYLNKYF